MAFLRFPRTSKNIAEAVLEMGGGRLLLIRERQRERERERQREGEREREKWRETERERASFDISHGCFIFAFYELFGSRLIWMQKA